MRIRSSKRGLTFSFAQNETFRAGTKYRYFIDQKKKEVVIIPDDEGKYVMSRKGIHEKPLVDLRNAEIRSLIEDADYIEVGIGNDRITVTVVKGSVSFENLSDRDVTEMFDRSEKETFCFDRDLFLEHDETISKMLQAGGFLSAKTAEDISYVFDTISLFSGAGLLDYPFSRDECFNLKFAVDFDEEACRTYRENIGDHIMCMDIRELEDKDVPDTDLVIGGPCCQGYSNANRAGNNARDEKSRLLVDDYIRIVKAKNPLMFVIENVRQFITKENGRYLERVIEGLSDNYNITYSIVNDNEVGGYSIRTRMILIGSSKKMPKVIIPDVQLSRKKTTGEALCLVTPDWYNYSDVTVPSAETVEKMKQVRPGHNYKDIREMAGLDRHSCTYKRLAPDEPCIALPNWRKVNIMPPVGNRVLTVSEAAALMGLKKDFHVLGKLSAKQQQIGNGTTQAMASFVKCIVKNALIGYANKLFNGVSVMAMA